MKMKHVSNRTVYKNIIKVFVVAIVCITAFLARADYPIMSQHYAADPTAVEWNGRLYVYCSNDEENTENSGYIMDSIVCFSTDDLKNWTDHGVVFDADELSSWYSGTAWAPCIVLKDSQFYLYFGDAYWGISVVTSSSPTGPFTAPKNDLVVKRESLSGGTPGADSEWLFDPGVFVDDDDTVHLYFGGGGADQARYIELNTNMYDAIGSAVTIEFPDFFEASHMHKYNGVYYYSYADNYDSDYTDPPPTPGSQIGYMTSSNPAGPFTYQGVALGPPPDNYGNNNHHTIFTYQGQWYCVYHNRYQATVDGVSTTEHRNICLDQLSYNPDGTMQQVVCTQDGLPQLKNFDPYVQVEAETLAAQSGVKTESCSEGGMNVTSISNGDWIRIRGVNFQDGADEFLARVAATNSDSSIELRLDSLGGTLLGTCDVPNTGGVQTWTTASCTVSNASGVHDLYFSFEGPDGIDLFNFNKWQFESDSNDITPPEPNVMTWASLPSAAGPTSITMTATTATDDHPPVLYYFECITDGDANSGWQTNTTYVAQELNPDTQYTFRVKARDSSSNQNETGWSTTESATTDPPDTTPPSPNPMAWAAGGEPSATGPSSITMTAATATDAVSPPVEYYFECTTDSDANSTWQTNPTYVAQGLNPLTQYTFRVRARDSYLTPNVTGFSGTASATTGPPPTDIEILGDWVEGTSHDPCSGYSRALIFITHAEDDVAITLNSVTYGGQSMTPVIERVTGTSGYRAYVAAYILDDAGIEAATSGTFVPDWTTTPENVSYASVFLGSVNQTTSIGATASDSSTSSTPNPITTSPLSTDEGDMVFVGATCGNTGDYTVNNGFTEAYEHDMASSTGTDGYKSATGADETPSVTHNSVNRQVIIGFVVQAMPSVVDYPPAAPTGLVATAGNELVSLDWDDNGETDLASYNVYRSTDQGGGSGGYDQINISLVVDSDYVDNSADNFTPYYYVVKAVDANNNESGFSNEASATPDYQNCNDVQAGGDGLVSDLTDDCYVNLEDLEIITGYWLDTNCGSSDNCEGADFEPTDGDVDFEDFGDFAVDWMLCNKPGDLNCTPNWP